MTEKPKILIVDDKPENLYALNKLLLQHLNVEVIQALSGIEALNLILAHDFCLAIVDIQMPEMDGYELVEFLRSNKDTATLPVIFVSAIYSDEYHHRKGYEAGAVDFMSKPFVPEILLSKVKVFIELYHQRQALQQANLALTALNADKDKFFSIISHDLRSPFTALMGNAEFMLQTLNTLSQQDILEMVQAIYQQSKNLHNLLDNLLTWAQLQRTEGMHSHFETIELGDLVQEMVTVLAPNAAKKEINLNNTITDPCQVQADRRMLETVIRNLTGNAIKFTPRGGQVMLALECNGSESRPGQVTVSVRDSGVGMSQADLAKLFRIDATHSTRGTEREPGSGLGLTICKEMVERNGGQIWVESALGQGTTVEFTLPLAHSG
jgi:two-component system, sensor histidine kinase and response regulator